MSELNDRLDKLIEEVRMSPDKRKRMYSKTFWENLKIERRTDQRTELVLNYLIDHGIVIKTEHNEFGSTEKEEWFWLFYWDVPYPDDSWFAEMSTKVFENEQEVDVFFLTPLFKTLGYQEDDFTFEYKVDVARRLLNMLPKNLRKKYVDLALFNGIDRADTNLLVICEAKRPEKPNSRPKLKNLKDAEKCLSVYRVGCSTSKRFVATNGDVVRVYRRGRIISEEDLVLLIEVDRREFKKHWHSFYLSVGKPILVGELDG